MKSLSCTGNPIACKTSHTQCMLDNATGAQAQRMVPPSEACEILGVSSATLKRWRHSDRLMRGVHYVQYGPKTIRYSADWLELFRATGGRGSHQFDVARHLDQAKRLAA